MRVSRIAVLAASAMSASFSIYGQIPPNPYPLPNVLRVCSTAGQDTACGTLTWNGNGFDCLNAQGITDYITIDSIQDGRIAFTETNHKNFLAKYTGYIGPSGTGSGTVEANWGPRHFSWTWTSSPVASAAASHPPASAAAGRTGPPSGKVDLTGRWTTGAFANNAGEKISLGFIIVQKGESVKMILDFPGKPHLLMYNGHFDGPGRLVGKSRSASNSDDNPNWMTETMLIVDATHIKSAITSLVLAKVAGPSSLQAADMVPAGESSKPYLRAAPFDLNGTWQGTAKDAAMFKLIISQQKDGNLTIRYAMAGGTFFRARYTQNPNITGQGIARNSDLKNPKWIEKSVFVDDPDHLHFNSEDRSDELFRVTNPAPHDLACDSQNSNHVARYYAMVRGRTADSQNDFAAAKCWLTISSEQGYAPAQSLLAALLVRRPDASAADYGAAFRLATKSAQQGDIAGQLELASFYREGKGTPRDPQQAQFWTQRAQQSKAAAQWKLWNSNVFLGLSPLDIAGLALKAANATIADADESARRLSCIDGHRSDCEAR